MSLRHILNDEPVPLHAQYPPSSHTFSSNEHMTYTEDLGPPSPPRSYVSQRHSREPSTAHHYYHPPSQHEPEWDPRSNHWSPERRPYASEDSRYAYDQDHVVSPVEPSTAYPLEDDQDHDVISKKRRKGDEDPEYMPSKPKRVGAIHVHSSSTATQPERQTSQRKTRKSREWRPIVDPSATPQKIIDDEPLPDSSDLEDCQEIWMDELGNYMLETKQRQNQVSQYFWSSVLVWA